MLHSSVVVTSLLLRLTPFKTHRAFVASLQHLCPFHLSLWKAVRVFGFLSTVHFLTLLTAVRWILVIKAHGYFCASHPRLFSHSLSPLVCQPPSCLLHFFFSFSSLYVYPVRILFSVFSHFQPRFPFFALSGSPAVRRS